MANPGSIGSLAPKGEDALVRRIEDIERQIKELAPSVASSFGPMITRLNGLTTVSAAGATVSTGNTPGDSTFRWFDSSPALTVQTQCPTGRLLVTVGTGQCTLAPGNSSAVGVITFSASSPSGWTYALDSIDSRVFFVNNTSIGVPLQLNVPLTGVPTNETITITVKYGIWSSSTTTLASANFQSNYVIAQVLAN